MITRTFTMHLKRIAQHFPVVLLTGPRQVGKSTLLENYISEDYNYVTLDDLNEREKALNDPALFIQDHQPPVMIDEVQYAPQLFSYIKIYVDRHREQKGLFLLTGSQKFSLMQGVQESLAGRVAVIDLLGLSQREINGDPHYAPFLPDTDYLESFRHQPLQNLTEQELFRKIWLGSFPALILLNGEDRETYYSSYVRTYLDRDIKGTYNIKDTITYHNFLKAVAARTGQLLNFADLAKDVAIDNKTAKLWLSALEASGLVQLLQPYYNNITKRLVKTPKLYFLDTGLAAYLTGWDTPKSLSAGAMSGAILETFVYGEILKSFWHNSRQPNLYFYRDRDAKEVDFLLEANNTLYGVEVKKTMMPSPNLAKSFAVLKNLQKPLGTNIILSLKPEYSTLSPNTVSLPIWGI